METNEDRLLNLELSLLGKWDCVSNKHFSYLFMNHVDVAYYIGGELLMVKYELFIKDEKMFIKIINDLNRQPDEVQIKEYEVLEIYKDKGILRLLTDHGEELRFHHDKGGIR